MSSTTPATSSLEGLADDLPDGKSCELLGPTALVRDLSAPDFSQCSLALMIGGARYPWSFGYSFLGLQETQGAAQTSMEDMVRKLRIEPLVRVDMSSSLQGSSTYPSKLWAKCLFTAPTYSCQILCHNTHLEMPVSSTFSISSWTPHLVR